MLPKHGVLLLQQKVNNNAIVSPTFRFLADAKLHVVGADQMAVI